MCGTACFGILALYNHHFMSRALCGASSHTTPYPHTPHTPPQQTAQSRKSLAFARRKQQTKRQQTAKASRPRYARGRTMMPIHHSMVYGYGHRAEGKPFAEYGHRAPGERDSGNGNGSGPILLGALYPTLPAKIGGGRRVYPSALVVFSPLPVTRYRTLISPYESMTYQGYGFPYETMTYPLPVTVKDPIPDSSIRSFQVTGPLGFPRRCDRLSPVFSDERYRRFRLRRV